MWRTGTGTIDKYFYITSARFGGRNSLFIRFLCGKLAGTKVKTSSEHPFSGCFKVRIRMFMRWCTPLHRIGILVDRPSRSILRQTEGLRYSVQDWTLVLGFELILHTESVHRFSLPLISFSVPPHQLSLHPPHFSLPTLFYPIGTCSLRHRYIHPFRLTCVERGCSSSFFIFVELTVMLKRCFVQVAGTIVVSVCWPSSCTFVSWNRKWSSRTRVWTLHVSFRVRQNTRYFFFFKF